MWVTRLAPARSCRSSMFWVTSVSRRRARRSRVQPGEREMGGVGLRIEDVPAAEIVEGVNLLRVFGEGFGGRQLHRVEPRPEAPLVAKGAEFALGRNARARENEDFHDGFPCGSVGDANPRHSPFP